MPMHCSANVGPAGDVALFFGLSGTGKTTLSADPKRTLIGDDEHGWGPQGVFNFEGGCYAKCIKLSAEAEPEIYATTHRFGTVLENVVFDPDTRICDFDDDSKTENTRAAYPLEFIPNASRTGRAGMPKNIVFLTADAFGVMPPIAKLTPAQAMYHFLSGYTAKVAGTEKGLVGVAAGILHLLRRAVPAAAIRRSTAICCANSSAQHDVDCWLVNTGWTGGIYGVGRRMPIKVTRTLLGAALDGSLKNVKFRTDPYFGFAVPTQLRRHRAASALSAEDLAEQTRVRPDRAQAGRHVPEELRAVRDPRRSRRARRGAGSAARRGVTLPRIPATITNGGQKAAVFISGGRNATDKTRP